MLKSDVQVQVYTDEYSNLRRGKLRIIKNLVVIGAAISLSFTAYDGLSMLQSTMNQEHGIGTVSQAVIYAGFCIASLLLTKYIIKKIGCKVGLIMATMFFIPYIAANFYSHWITMMPSAVLLGIGASILWGCQCTYFNVSALMYCTLTEARDDLKKQQIIKVKESSDTKSNHTSVEELSVSRSVEELSAPRTLFAIDGGDISVQVSELGEGPRFKSTEERTSNELPPNIGRNDGGGSCPRNEFATTRNSEDGNAKPPTKRRFSASLLASDLEGYRNSEKRKGSKLFDTLSTAKNENKVFSHPNPRQSAGYIETLQKFAGLESVTARFFGFIGFAFHSAQVWSNLVSYYVLHTDSIYNVTKNVSCACGAEFCNDVPACIEDVVHAIGVDVRYLLTGISVVLAVAAVILLVIFLDPLPSDKEPVTFSFKLMMATFNHCRRSQEQQLLIPISFYVGMVQGFYTADFTKSFVACAWGTYHVGLVTIFYGLACAISATTAGMLVKYLGRAPLMVLGQFVNIGVNVLLLLWVPDPSQPHIFYISAAMWGVVLGTYWALLPALYGMIFKNDEEAAFGSYYLWNALGWFLSFSYSDYICTWIKMYILLGVSTLGVIGYLGTERMFYIKKNQISLKYAD